MEYGDSINSDAFFGGREPPCRSAVCADVSDVHVVYSSVFMTLFPTRLLSPVFIIFNVEAATRCHI